MGLLITIIIGIIAGAIGSWIYTSITGRAGTYGILGDLVAGIIGSYLAGVLFGAASPVAYNGANDGGNLIWQIIVGAIGAAIVIAIWRAITSRNSL